MKKTKYMAFGPFYSTKMVEGGSGLDLFVRCNLVQDQEIGGRLFMKNKLGMGTWFGIELPTHASLC